MEKENIKPTAMEIAHKHMDLKDILRKKIIDFSIIKGQEIAKIFDEYFKKKNDADKEYAENEKRRKEFIRTADNDEEYNDLNSKIFNSLTAERWMENRNEQEVKNKIKKLTQWFRKENKALLDEYKDVGSKNRWNQSRFEFATRMLQKLKITDLNIDEFRKAIGFESVDIPRHVWEKQALESKWINIEKWLASLTPRESEIMNIYFEWWDMKLLAEKNNLSEQRVRQIRKKAFRRLRARAGKNSEK